MSSRTQNEAPLPIVVGAHLQYWKESDGGYQHPPKANYTATVVRIEKTSLTTTYRLYLNDEATYAGGRVCDIPQRFGPNGNERNVGPYAVYDQQHQIQHGQSVLIFEGTYYWFKIV